MMIIISSCSVLIVLTFIECSASQNVFVVSGEAGNETRLKVQNDSYECVLPQFPENGIWTILNGNGGPGNKVEEDTILKFVCNPGFILTPEYPYMICDRHGFPKDIPQCLRSPTYGYEHPENVTRSKRQYDSFKCTLPPFPENGKWTIINGDGRPGQEVEVDTGLKFQCHPGYKLTPKHPYIICDTNWSPELMPKCLKLCSPLYSTPTTTLKCKDVTGNAIGCNEATEGTYLTYQCIPYYEALGRKHSLYCSGGTWDFPKPVCQPVCGRKVSNDVTTLVFGGEDTKKYEYPWITAVYLNHEGKMINNCGGTLLNPRIVLTAAHCVTNSYGDTVSADTVEVGAGKYFNEYGDTRDIHAQYSKAARIIVHEEYKGDTRRFQFDIALIVTKRLFTLGPVVQPACYSNIDTIYPHVGSVGELAGWGVTETGKPSDTLRTIRIPYKEKIICTQELPNEWSDRYNFDDKMCAGFYKQNKSVCPGDSGSGLVFRNPEDNRFYVHGVVSISPKIVNGFCNNQDNALFTKVAHYYEWLDKKSTANYVEDCILPAFPRDGKWELEVGQERLPGDIVSSTAVLIFSCRKGYRLSTINSKFFCGPSLVPPTCELLCPPINFPPATISKCRNKQNITIDCEDAVDGSTMTFTCPTGYVAHGARSGTASCSSGSWGRNRPQCTRNQGSPHVDVVNKNEFSTEGSVTESSSDTVQQTSGIKVICTYASWRFYHGVKPEDFDPSLCTHFVYTYVGINEKGELRNGDPTLDVRLFPRVVDLKKKNRKLKVMLSIGGSGASNATLFSGLAADAEKTAAFIKSASHFMKTYDFDGLDIDWFYPEKADKENYITFLRKVKEAFDKEGWLLSSSVRADPEDTGYDASKMNEVLDWVTVKSYDMYGSWSTYSGNHNALYPSSKEFEWEKEHLNMNAVANNWMKAGLNKNKLVLSVAFYGRSFTLKDKNQHSIYSLVAGNGPGEDGWLKYSEICSNYGNYTEVWDDDQKSPYRYKDDKWFAYNSKEAVSIKGDYIKSKGFTGVNVYPVDADDVHGVCGTKQVLLKYLNEGLGNKVNFDN
ncbi:uncharacterized protein [Leptinotarsa decemlineata]|uniref:uncharacterized protein n=1 Tax=Leptinotarsa decemlineata TaxID=7539 RepID=UPI003D308CF0